MTSMSSYETFADAKLIETRQWLDSHSDGQECKNNGLPDDVWKLPKSCPLWNGGCSLMQVSWVVDKLRQELKSNDNQT